VKGNDWVAMCGKNGATAGDLLLDGKPIGNGQLLERPQNGEVTINTDGSFGCCANTERSDFAIAELIVWEGDSLKQGSDYLLGVLKNGRLPVAAPLQDVKAPEANWVLLSKENSATCFFPRTLRPSFQFQAQNPASDCYMDLSKLAENYDTVTGSYNFQIIWRNRDGSTATVQWRPVISTAVTTPSL
jgi:hypothetical protein